MRPLAFDVTLPAADLSFYRVIGRTWRDTAPGGSVAYSGFVTQGQVYQGTQQCTDFQTFQANIVATGGNWSSVQIFGSMDPVGNTCASPAEATTICNAIGAGGTVTVPCGGVDWFIVGDCFGSLEIEVGGAPPACNACDAREAAIRPCFITDQWGGFNNLDCSAPSQTIEVVCTL